MRSEQEMMDLIMGTAREDERIRGVLLCGSRISPDAVKDDFQDYDIVYLVESVKPFVEDSRWIDRFGEPLIIQEPDKVDEIVCLEKRYVYLMQFMDGNRIDLTLMTVPAFMEVIGEGSQKVLLDKDDLFHTDFIVKEGEFLPIPPTAARFAGTCNEFWWVSPYVAKALWRQEFPLAKHMIETYVRKQMIQVLEWWVGIHTRFQKTIGKGGKYLERLLPPELWEPFYRTYRGNDYEEIWDSLMAMGELFEKVAYFIAGEYGFQYNQREADNVRQFLRDIRKKPR